MAPNSPPRMIVVKKEEKEGKLKAFLERALMSAGPHAEVCVVAKEASSPVLLALEAFAAELRLRGITLRILVAKREKSGLIAVSPDAVRHLADARCHDAHELLVLGDYAWVGDSMRRNPATSDSFEMHAEGHPQTAAVIAASFARLWAIAIPVDAALGEAPRAGLALAGELAALGNEVLGNEATGSTVTALTRH